MYKKPNPIKQLIEKGKMLSSAKGSSNYMKKDSKSAILAIGDIGKPGYDKYGAELMSTKRARLKKEKESSSSKKQPVDSLYGSGKSKSFNDGLGRDKGFVTKDKPAKTDIKPTIKSKPSSDKNNKKTTLVKKQTPKSTPKDNTPSAAQTAASKLEQRAKTAIAKRKKAPKTKDGVNAVIEHQNKKGAASKIKDTKTKSKAEIRSAKTTAKQAGKSKQEIRLAKTKAKAKNARIETTSKETAAQGGKKAQEKRAKTIRLEKRAKRIEARIAKRKAKK